MILYYAVGGGLGHLVRARAVLHTLGRERDAAILTASPFARDRRVTGGLPVIELPASLERERAGYRDWLSDLLRAHRPDELWLDAFPAGVLGELCGLQALAAVGEVNHVARRLRWPSYLRRLRGSPPRLSRTYVVEELAPDHHAALLAASDQVAPLALEDPPSAPPAVDLPEGCLMVVHSGPAGELRALMREAEARRTGAEPIVLVAPRHPGDLPRGATWVDACPAAPLFPQAAALVTGAGFNTMRQAAGLGAPHHAFAFARPLDDQHARLHAARRPHQAAAAAAERRG